MNRKRYKKDPVDPTPRMPRSDDEFEEKRIEKEFTLLFGQFSKMPPFSSFTAACNFLYRQGYFTGKTAGIRESLGSLTTETLKTSPLGASVRETAGATKEKQDGITKGD